MPVWKYDAEKSSRGKLKEPITRKQIEYIQSLLRASRNRRYALNIFGAISDWKHKHDPALSNLHTLTKGQAGFIISALRGDLPATEYPVPGIDNEEQKQKTLDAAREIIERRWTLNFPQAIDDDE